MPKRKATKAVKKAVKKVAKKTTAKKTTVKKTAAKNVQRAKGSASQNYQMYCRALHELTNIGEKLNTRLETNTALVTAPENYYMFSAKLWLDTPFPISINSMDITENAVAFLDALYDEITKAIKEYKQILTIPPKGMGTGLVEYFELLKYDKEVRANWLKARVAEFIMGNRPNSIAVR